MAKKAKKDERAFWTLDAETDPFKKWTSRVKPRVPKPFIWGLYTGAGFHTFTTIEQVVDCIKDQEVIVYAHNGGKFDFQLEANTVRLLDFINLREDMKIIDGRLVSAKIGKAEIRDSWNLLPAPLRDFGSKLEIDYRKLEADIRNQHMPEIIQYLKQDVVGLWEAIDGFEHKYGRHLTQAGAAMKQWEKISGQKPPKSDAGYFAKFQRYYYGGRVQCFEKGYIKGPLEVIDIRSAYPRAMLDQHPYATEYVELAMPRTVEGSDMVTIDCISNGALPFRDDSGSITFPRDTVKRRYYVSGWEVIEATNTKSLREVEIRNAIRFTGLQDFSIYINHFYEQRKTYRAEGDTAQAFFAKILMNSLYGKFGANPDNYGNFMAVPWEEGNEYAEKKQDGTEGQFYEGKDFRFNGMFGKHAIVRADLDNWQKHFINVATAASITGWVRAYLWRALDASDGPVYCDTDCVIARGMPSNLEIGEELGQWNHEGTANEMWLAGKKLYLMKGKFEKGKTVKMASKGVKPDPKAIKKAALGGVATVRSQAPTFSIKGKRPVYFQERKIRMTA